MTRHLFLEGPSGCGKSTAICRVLWDILPCAGGFGTRRLADSEGQWRGFQHVPASELTEIIGVYEPDLPGVFIECGEGCFSFKREVFTTFTLGLLRDDKTRRFYLLDELGGTELLIPEFAAAVRSRLDGSAPCIGVWKAPGNSAHMKRMMKPGKDYNAAYAEFYAKLLEDKNVTVVSTGDYGELEEAVKSWKYDNKLC